MKKLFLIAATSIVAFSAITSCKKSDSSPSYSMKATIGSTSFNATNCVAIATGGALSISGWTGTTTTAAAPMMSITILSWNSGTQTVAFDSTGATGSEAYTPSTTSSLPAKTGTVSITSVSSTAISGTYSFTATDGTAITGGTFTAKR